MGDGPGEQESPRELVGFFTRMATSNLKNSSYQHAGNRRWVEASMDEHRTPEKPQILKRKDTIGGNKFK